MWRVFIIIEFLELVLVNWRDSDDDHAWVLGLGGGMLNDLLQVLLIHFQGDMLLMARDTCIVCTEEDGLGSQWICPCTCG